MNIKKFFILSFIVFSFFSVNLVNASCSLQSIKEYDRAGLISLLKELISHKQLNNKADLVKFKATEIVSNDLPDSIEFWTEAYCPGSGTNYDYKLYDQGSYWDYYLSSCEKGEIGSHGGCKTCIMSKIKLSQDHNATEGNFKKNIKFEDGVGVYVEKLGSTKEESEVRVWKDGKMKQIFPSYIPIDQFWDDFNIYIDVKDYNNDGYVDLSFSGGSEVSTHYEEHRFVFLYDPAKKGY